MWDEYAPKDEKWTQQYTFPVSQLQKAPDIIGVEKGKGAGWPQVEGIGRAIKPSHHRQNQTSLSQELGDHIGITPASQTSAP